MSIRTGGLGLALDVEGNRQKQQLAARLVGTGIVEVADAVEVIQEVFGRTLRFDMVYGTFGGLWMATVISRLFQRKLKCHLKPSKSISSDGL